MRPYHSRIDLLASVGDLCFIWVVGGANHGTGRGWDAAGAHSGAARLAYGEPLFFEGRGLAHAAGASFGVSRPRSSWTT